MIFLKYELGLNYFMENRGIKKLNVKIESDKIKTSNLDSTKQEIITHLKNLVDVCYHSKKLSHNDLYEVKELIKKLEAERFRSDVNQFKLDLNQFVAENKEQL